MTTAAPEIRFNPSDVYRYPRRLNVSIKQLMSLDYVREGLHYCPNPIVTLGRRTRPLFGEQCGPLVAWAVVGRVQPYLFTALIWWLKVYDRPVAPNGVYQLSPEKQADPRWRHWGPCEAVPPSRVLEFFPELQGV